MLGGKFSDPVGVGETREAVSGGGRSVRSRAGGMQCATEMNGREEAELRRLEGGAGPERMPMAMVTAMPTAVLAQRSDGAAHGPAIAAGAVGARGDGASGGGNGHGGGSGNGAEAEAQGDARGQVVLPVLQALPWADGPCWFLLRDHVTVVT